MAEIVYLFPDTNVLVQCRTLHELDWTAWRKFDEVHLIITRPVQSEIDDHKNKGGDRLARRARKASSLLRDIIISGRGYSLVRPADPVVKLFIKPELRPSQELTETLDYSRPDDKLVGIVHAFAHQNPGINTRLLTHDTGPMASAQMVGLAITPVPDDWLLPPEPSESDKRIRSLEAEVARLKETEPRFSIACVSAEGNKLTKLELDMAHYEAITPAELSTLIEVLTRRFPLATEFGPGKRAERLVPGPISMMGMKEIFTPATETEIKEYRQEHRQWLSQCKGILRDLHDTIHGGARPSEFVFSARNDGTRPAIDALVTFRAKGQFKIMPPPYRHRDDDDDKPYEQAEIPATLPSPPIVPRGSWANLPASWHREFGSIQGIPRAWEGITARPIISEHLLRSISPPKPRDPNGFYYKPDRPSFPGEEFSLECRQWRHGVEPELFSVQIHVDAGTKDISGAVECYIHAGNLSQTTEGLFPVRIRVLRKSILEIAEVMVERVEGER